MEERKALYEIKMKLLTGLISYEQAKELSAEHINALNIRGERIAMKHGRKFVKTTFSQQMR